MLIRSNEDWKRVQDFFFVTSWVQELPLRPNTSELLGPSSLTVKMEYLFAFQFRYCEVSVKDQCGRSKVALLKVQSCKISNKKYTIASTQIRSTEIFVFIAVLVFKLLNRA